MDHCNVLRNGLHTSSTQNVLHVDGHCVPAYALVCPAHLAMTQLLLLLSEIKSSALLRFRITFFPCSCEVHR